MSGCGAIIETVILAAVIAVANALFGASDPGWLALNPTPYLLVPMLIGLRYGFASGLLAGGLAALVSAGGGVLLGGRELSTILAEAPFTLLSLPAIGVVAGELHRTVLGKSAALAVEAEGLEADAARLRADLALAHEAQCQLQEQLALYGAEFCSADIELGKLFDADAGPLLPSTLAALGRLCDLGAAAFYALGDSNRLELEAAYGDPELFPERLEGDAAVIAETAFAEGVLVTRRGLWEAGGDAGGDLIAALAWPGGKRVLVVGDMPFAAINWQNFARLEGFCRWVAETENARAAGAAEGVPVLGEREFRELANLAGKSVASHGLPSTLLLFTALAGGPDQTSLQAAILPNLGAAAVAAQIGRPTPHLAVLLPMGGARTAEGVIVGAGDGVECETFSIDSGDAVEAIWEHLGNVA